MTLLKFHGDQNGQPTERQVYWGRANRDGLPYRANGPVPVLREEEFQATAERVVDAKMRLFDLSDEKQLETYRDVIDKAANGWFNIIIRKHKWSRKEDGSPCILVYMEWLEPYLETPSGLNKQSSTDTVEVTHGRS